MQERTAAASTHSVAVAALRHRHCSSWQCQCSGFLVAEAGQLQHDSATYKGLAGCSGLAGLCRTRFLVVRTTDHFTQSHEPFP